MAASVIGTALDHRVQQAYAVRVHFQRLQIVAPDGLPQIAFAREMWLKRQTNFMRLPARSAGGDEISMDRSSIERHLLSSKTDPFNKQPLSADQLVPNAHLKVKIAAWKAQQRQQGGAQPMQQ